MPTTFPFAAVLFDMDGVIADTMPLHRQIWQDFARDHGLKPTLAEIRAFDGKRAADIVRALFGDLDDAAVKALADARESVYHDVLPTANVPPIRGIGAFLDQLEALGVPKVLATSATPENVTRLLDRLGLKGRFDAVVTAADVTHGKPHPEVYLTAADRVGRPIAQCLVIEDALPGIAAGVASGATVLGLATSEPAATLLQAGARFTARDFKWEAAPWEAVR